MTVEEEKEEKEEEEGKIMEVGAKEDDVREEEEKELKEGKTVVVELSTSRKKNMGSFWRLPELIRRQMMILIK